MSKTVKSVRGVKDNVDATFKALFDLINKQVLVGIPESKTKREGPVNNATIGYAMEFGLPANNVPARPFLIPGVEKARRPALAEMEKAAKAALDGDQGKANQHLQAAGIVAENAVKRRINSNIPPPLQPDTIRNRKYQRGTQSRRESETAYLDMVADGQSPKSAQADAGIVALVNTGQLRNAVTSVVRDVRKKTRAPKGKDLGIPSASEIEAEANKS